MLIGSIGSVGSISSKPSQHSEPAIPMKPIILLGDIYGTLHRYDVEAASWSSHTSTNPYILYDIAASPSAVVTAHLGGSQKTRPLDLSSESDNGVSGSTQSAFWDGSKFILGVQPYRQVFTSSDGESFTLASQTAVYIDTVSRIARNGVGEYLGVDGSDQSKAYYSTDGMAWLSMTVSEISSFNIQGVCWSSSYNRWYLSGAAYNNNSYCRIAWGTASPAGFVLQGSYQAYGGPQNAQAIADSGDGHMIASGVGGTLLRTVDGETWTQIDVSSLTGGAVSLHRVKHHPLTGYVVVGEYGVVLTSPTGEAGTWALISGAPNVEFYGLEIVAVPI